MKIEIRTIVTINGDEKFKQGEVMEYVRYLQSINVGQKILDDFYAGKEVKIVRSEKADAKIIETVFQAHWEPLPPQ